MPITVRYWLVMPAAGIGQRMQAERPKQYLPLHGKTVIEWSLQPFLQDPRCQAAMVALAPQDVWWAQLGLAAHAKVHATQGGADRAASVMAGLQALATLDVHANDWVLVHDSARPCITKEDVDALLAIGDAEPVGALLATPVTETIKRATEGFTHDGDTRVAQTVSREHLWRAQTPQMFKLGQLQQALQQAHEQHLHITDESSAIEALGLQPRLIAGRADNLKITLPEDLALAEQILATRR